MDSKILKEKMLNEKAKKIFKKQMRNIRLYFSITFRRKLKSDNLNESLKLNRFIGSYLLVLPIALFLNYIIFSLISFIFNFFFNAKDIIANFKEYDYFSLFNISNAYSKLSKQGSFGYSVIILLTAMFLIFTIRKIYKIRVNYSDKIIKKGYKATSRWTNLKELYKQYQKIDMLPTTRVKIRLTEEEKKEILEKYSKEELKELEIKDGIDIHKNYKKYLRDKTKDFKFEGYIFNENEIYKVLKAINWYEGDSGIVISRWKDTIFVDNSFAHTFGIGTTSSGKTEMFVYTLIDICSRNKDINKRCSFVVFDPKLELYKSSKNTLEEREYIVRLVNIDNPKLSAGINPLDIVRKLYKEGKKAEAEQMAKTYAYSVFNSNQDDELEGIWKKTATQLFTALIIAQTADCILLDEIENKERLRLFNKRKAYYTTLSDDEKEMYKIIYDEAIENNEDVIKNKKILAFPEYAKFIETNENEKNINIYSVIHFFRNLCDRASLTAGEDVKAREKKTSNLLDDYFNARESSDYARALYEISKTSAERTKGSIYLNMQTELDIFAIESIANMTAESDIDIDDIGYGDKPMAIFLGIPAEDKSNHFLATTFMSQVSQRMFKRAMSTRGEMKRKVHMLFDELGNMPQVFMLQNQVTINRTIGMHFHLWVQAIEQMQDVYGKYANNIIENCGNQVYIMSTGTESSEYFEKLLGNKEVISLSRQGELNSTSKMFTETPEERPLMFHYELRQLKKGECVISRPMKREDILGVDVRPYPILNEVCEKIGILSYIKCFIRCIKKRLLEGKMKDRQNRITSFKEELSVFISDEKRYQGTSLYYKYQYMSREFPNAKEIRLEDICTESREHIDFRKRINDPEKTIEKLKEKIEKEKRENEIKEQKEIGQIRLNECENFGIFHNLMIETFDEDYFDELGISLEDKIEDVFTRLNLLKDTDFKEKKLTKKMFNKKLSKIFGRIED